MDNPDSGFSRRQSLGLGASVLATAATTGLFSSAAEATSRRRGGGVVDFVSRVDFSNPQWNRDTYARIDGELDTTKQKVSRITGKVYGVRDNEKIRPLFKMDGFSVVRTLRLPDGNWRRVLKEIVFYRDIATGRIMESWHNPYTNEDVRVVPIANDPFNYDIRDTKPQPPSYGGLNAETRAPEPFLLDWSEGPNDTLILETGIDLFYPAALQPAQWPRESAGSFNRVSEHFLFFVKRQDIENRRLTALPVTGSWSRITPWLPWMLMGQAPGCINYFASFATMTNGIADLPADLVAAARAVNPGYLEAPTEDYGPSLSSLEHYAREQRPAPVPAGWSPPQPPAPPQLPPMPPRAG